MDSTLIEKYLRETRLVLAPKRLLSAYGDTRLNYHLVSPVDALKDRTRVREGSVLSERPVILTADVLRERFAGFGEDAHEFSRWLGEQYRDLLRALEYTFKNQDLRSRVLHDDPRAVTGRIHDDLLSRSVPDTALIECPDAGWSLAVMKLTLDEARRSFPSHLKTYEEHGLFDPGSNARRRLRREIDALFAAAKQDPAARAALGKRLKDEGLFAEYEDRFLALF